MVGGSLGSCDETTTKKVITLQKAMTKKRLSVFFRKNRGDTFAASGDTNHSDATEHDNQTHDFNGGGLSNRL